MSFIKNLFSKTCSDDDDDDTGEEDNELTEQIYNKEVETQTPPGLDSDESGPDVENYNIVVELYRLNYKILFGLSGICFLFNYNKVAAMYFTMGGYIYTVIRTGEQKGTVFKVE